MLSKNHLEQLDEAEAVYKFEKSGVYHTLKEILEAYREKAIEEIEHGEPNLDSVRKLHAVNDLVRHIQVTIIEKSPREVLAAVAEEMGVDLDELRIRREIDG